MKRYLEMVILASCLAGWVGLTPTLGAQNPAAADAAREEAEDRYRRMTAEVATLKENLALAQQQISALEKSIRELSEQVTRANNHAASQEKIARLAEQLQKVDEARMADNKRVTETMEDLRKAIKSAAALPPSRPPVSSGGTSHGPSVGGTTANEECFEYVVQKGDTLSGIVKLYNEQKIKVTTKGVKDANPTVKWDRLQVGQKILVPKPKS
jgi:TolA-binding protein